jgi:hypothetical protein
MTKLIRETALDMIRTHISKHGHHIYYVAGGGPLPCYAYTIGLTERLGVELILAGASYFSKDETFEILNRVAREVDLSTNEVTCPQGRFILRSVDVSWIRPLLLGAIDYYQRDSLRAVQLIPDSAHCTLDVPDMQKPLSGKLEPVWQWVSAPWGYSVPPESTAVTNLAALCGSGVTEAARWEEKRWELFAGAGPDVQEHEMRVVPLGTLLAADPSLVPVLSLPKGAAMWRNSPSEQWQNWKAK